MFARDEFRRKTARRLRLKVPAFRLFVVVEAVLGEAMSESENPREERRRLKKLYAGQYEFLSQLLFEEDPMGLNYGDNDDEYDPEVGTILPRLHECSGPQDLAKVISEEFSQWFGQENVGPPESFLQIAEIAWPKLKGPA